MSEYLIDGTKLTNIADAIREKTGETAQIGVDAMPAKIRNISGGGTEYVVGTPVSYTLTGWDPDSQGTTYALKAIGYKVGDNGLQIGLPSGSSAPNTQAAVAAALTAQTWAYTAANTSNNVAGYTTVTIVATNAPTRELTIALFGLEPVEAAEQVKITTAAIEGVTAPVKGAKPVSKITGDQFTGTVTWSPTVDNTFAASTAYTATITLTPKAGYKLDGVAANFFTVEGATSVSNSANSGVVTAGFPATGASS